MPQANELARRKPKAKAAREPSFSDLLTCAHDLADISEKAVLKYFRKKIDVENKSREGFDPVTLADRAAEVAITQALKKRYPHHNLTGEEFGHINGGGPYRWVVDPIDGTRAYIMGSPMWGTLIGVLHEEEPVLGLMNQPFTGERFWSAETASFMRLGNGKPQRLAARSCAKLSNAIVTTTHPDLFAAGKQHAVHEALRKNSRMIRYGGDCYHFALLASGFIDIAFEAGVKSYDVVALIPIIERAGGVMTTWDGGSAASGGNVVASGDPRLHEAVLKMIAKL